MLTDQKHFKKIEETLRENGTIERFEREHGPIRGKLLITEGDLPEDLDFDIDEDRRYAVFIGSYDFYDMEIGVVLYLDPIETAGPIWFTPQRQNAEEPSQEWIEYFIQTVVGSINTDGSYGIPICSFMADAGDFTVVPTFDEE